MATFTVQWKYASGLGRWEAGDVIEVSEELAEAVNKDSPGVLVEGGGMKAEAGKGKNRMVVEGETREPLPLGFDTPGTTNQATQPAQEVMTSENFGAVKLGEHRKGSG